MKVLHVIPSLAPRHGGPTEAVLNMVRALRQSGVDATIVSSDDDVGGRLPVPVEKWLEHEGIPTYFIRRVTSRSHTLVGFTFSPRFVPWLWREIPRQDFVHVHTVFSFPANVAMAVARRRGKPYAARPLGQLCNWSLKVRSGIKRLQLAAIGRRNLDSAAFLHLTSQMEANEVADIGLRCPVKVLPLGIQIPNETSGCGEWLRTALGIPKQNRIALFLSRLHPKKGLDVLLRGLARVRDAKIDLVICGDGDQRYVGELRQLADQLGLASRVHWLGFVTGERKWQIVQGCDFFVLPSTSENFGIAVIEALACGLFIVVSPHVGLAPEIAKTGIGCSVAIQEISLADALVAVSLNERFDVESRAARRAFAAQRFSWDSATRSLIAAYEEVLRLPNSSLCESSP
jgi:glycosyltransferase involved in cell wall biosynthesis